MLSVRCGSFCGPFSLVGCPGVGPHFFNTCLPLESILGTFVWFVELVCLFSFLSNPATGHLLMVDLEWCRLNRWIWITNSASLDLLLEVCLWSLHWWSVVSIHRISWNSHWWHAYLSQCSGFFSIFKKFCLMSGNCCILCGPFVLVGLPDVGLLTFNTCLSLESIEGTFVWRVDFTCLYTFVLNPATGHLLLVDLVWRLVYHISLISKSVRMISGNRGLIVEGCESSLHWWIVVFLWSSSCRCGSWSWNSHWWHALSRKSNTFNRCESEKCRYC